MTSKCDCGEPRGSRVKLSRQPPSPRKAGRTAGLHISRSGIFAATRRRAETSRKPHAQRSSRRFDYDMAHCLLLESLRPISRSCEILRNDSCPSHFYWPDPGGHCVPFIHCGHSQDLSVEKDPIYMTLPVIRTLIIAFRTETDIRNS